MSTYLPPAGVKFGIEKHESNWICWNHFTRKGKTDFLLL